MTAEPTVCQVWPTMPSLGVPPVNAGPTSMVTFQSRP